MTGRCYVYVSYPYIAIIQVKEVEIRDVLFDDYCTLSAGTEPEMSVGGLRRHIELVGKA